jgi:hypothetical protein
VKECVVLVAVPRYDDVLEPLQLSRSSRDVYRKSIGAISIASTAGDNRIWHDMSIHTGFSKISKQKGSGSTMRAGSAM